MVVVQTRPRKWKERDEISKNVDFGATDIWVRDFTVILMLKKVTEIYEENRLCHPAHTSFTFFKLSNRSKITHLNVSGLKIDILTNY